MSLIAHYLLHDGFEGLNQCDLVNSVQLNPDNSGTFPGSLYSGLKSERVFDITEDFSWFIAFKRNSAADAQLIDMRTSGSYGYQPLHMYSNGDIQFYVGIGSSSTGSEFSTGSHITINKWHYITLVKRSDRISCYVDGKFIGENINQHAIKLHNLPLYIGRRHDLNGSTAYSLNGMISDVRLYDHALSEEEIKKLSSDLVCHYTFDTIRSSEHSSDSSKSNLDGIGGSAIFDTPGAVGAWGARLAKFSDTVGDYIEINSAVKLVPPFTYSIWAKPIEDALTPSNIAKYVLLSNHGGDYDYSGGFSLYLTKSALNLQIRNTVYKIILTGVDIFDWHLYTITVNADNICTIYVDGELKHDSSYITLSSFSWNTYCPFTIGVQNSWNPESITYVKKDFYDGFIDDFRAYRRVLSQDEVKDLIYLRASIYDNGILEVPYYNNLDSAIVELADNNDIQLSKSGILSNLDLIEQEYKIINGKKFLKIFEHDVRHDPTNSSDNAYFKADHSEDLCSCGPNRFSMLGLLIDDCYNPENDEYEFLLTYPDDTNMLDNYTWFDTNEAREASIKADWNKAWSIDFECKQVTESPFKIILSDNFIKLEIVEAIPDFGIPGGILLECATGIFLDFGATNSTLHSEIDLNAIQHFKLSFNPEECSLTLSNTKTSIKWDLSRDTNGNAVLKKDTTTGLYINNTGSIYLGYNSYLKDANISQTYNLWRQNWSPFEDTLLHITHGTYTPLQLDYTTQWGSPAGENLKPGLGLNIGDPSSSLLDCEPEHNYWYGGVVQYKPYTEEGSITGFPGCDGRMHQWVQLWVRVDNTAFKEETFIANKTIFTKSLMEE